MDGETREKREKEREKGGKEKVKGSNGERLLENYSSY